MLGVISTRTKKWSVKADSSMNQWKRSQKIICFLFPLTSFIQFENILSSKNSFSYFLQQTMISSLYLKPLCLFDISTVQVINAIIQKMTFIKLYLLVWMTVWNYFVRIYCMLKQCFSSSPYHKQIIKYYWMLKG